MRHGLRILALAGLAMLACGVAVLVWPLTANGVSGTALRPRYGDVGISASRPLPGTALRYQNFGLRLPQHLVAKRRRVAGGLLWAGSAAAIAGGTAMARRGPSRRRTGPA